MAIQELIQARRDGLQADTEAEFKKVAKKLANVAYSNLERFKEGVVVDDVKVVLTSNEKTSVVTHKGESKDVGLLTIDFLDVKTNETKFSIMDVGGTVSFKNGGETRYNYFETNGLKMEYDFRDVANKAVELSNNTSKDRIKLATPIRL